VPVSGGKVEGVHIVHHRVTAADLILEVNISNSDNDRDLKDLTQCARRYSVCALRTSGNKEENGPKSSVAMLRGVKESLKATKALCLIP